MKRLIVCGMVGHAGCYKLCYEGALVGRELRVEWMWYGMLDIIVITDALIIVMYLKLYI